MLRDPVRYYNKGINEKNEMKKELEKVQKQAAHLERVHEKKLQELLAPLSDEECKALGYPFRKISELTRWQANGVWYNVHRSLCISRFEEFEVLQIDVQFGISLRNLFHNLKKTYDDLNSGKGFADASVNLYDIMRGAKRAADRQPHEALLLCTLFMCRDGEDVTKYDPELNAQKIEDWKASPIPMEEFFRFASSLAQGFTPDLQETSISISETLKKFEERIEKSEL